MSDAPKTPAPVFSLVERRPPVTTNDTWQPADLLRELLTAIEDGTRAPLNLMVCFMETLPDGNLRPITWTANLTYQEILGFCALQTAITLEDWRAR